MTAAERLAEIQARYSQWYDTAGYGGPVVKWPGRDRGETREHYMARNDVPALIGALGGVLIVAEIAEATAVQYGLDITDAAALTADIRSIIDDTLRNAL